MMAGGIIAYLGELFRGAKGFDFIKGNLLMYRASKKVDIKDAFFNVELKPVFIESESSEDMFCDGYEKLPRHFAVMDLSNNLAFSVVTNDYKLILNEEAYRLAASVMEEVFEFVTFENMECLNLIMPRTRSFCHMDLIHSSLEFEVFPDEKWMPFVRVTNSYNRTRRLKFEIGFCRLFNFSSIILEEKSVEISFAHTRRLDDEVKNWAENLGQIKEMERLLIEQVNNLQRFHIPSKFMLPLACKVFGVDRPKDDSDQYKLDVFYNFSNSIESLVQEYFSDMGEQGFAALNILMDYASYPDSDRNKQGGIDSMQRKVGHWIDEFVNAIEKRDFRFEKYLEKQLGSLNEIG